MFLNPNLSQNLNFRFCTQGSDNLICAAVESEIPKEVGSGTNGYTYFVANQLGGALTKLADVTPAQIKAARTLKKLFTGKLSAEVRNKVLLTYRPYSIDKPYHQPYTLL